MPARTTKPPPNSSAPLQFSGFDIPRQNWFKMPNVWTDITADITSLAELKIVEYVLKHSWGYQEYGLKKRISIDEFMSGRRRKNGSRMDRGTGLSKPSVVAGIKAAVQRGLLIEELDDSDKGRIKKYYMLRMHSDNDSSDSENDDSPTDEDDNPNASREDLEEDEAVERIFTPDVKNLNRGVKNLYPRGKESLPRTEKDTLERHLQERTTPAREDHSNNNSHGPNVDKTDVVVAILGFGIAKKVAQRLADHYSRERIFEKIDFLQFLLDERPDQVKNPIGWLRSAIEEDYGAPDGFISAEERQKQAEAEAQRQQAEQADRQAALQAAENAQKAKAAQKAEIEQQLAVEWGTDEEDRALWEQVQMWLKHSNFSPMFLAAIRLLKLDNGVAKLGVDNDFIANQLSHPGTLKQLSRAFRSQLKQDVEIELIVVDKIINRRSQNKELLAASD